VSHFRVRKYGTTVPISRDTALDMGLVRPTPAEQQQREAWRVEYAQRKQAASAALPVFVAQLAAVTNPVARVVLDLHKAEGGWCEGDDFGGYDGERPEWPCRTVEAVAVALGITVPPDLDMAERVRA
jgi:hypothetical protein